MFGLCERCGKPGKILHHKIILTPRNIDNPNVTLNWGRLQYLCHDCHEQIHNDSFPVREDVRFDNAGQLVEVTKRRSDNV